MIGHVSVKIGDFSDKFYVRILLFLAAFFLLLFENAARNIYARIAERSFCCIQALQADPEISLEQLLSGHWDTFGVLSLEVTEMRFILKDRPGDLLCIDS